MDKLLVDCGATCHVINSKHYFLTFDQSFDTKGQFIEVADGRRSNDLAKARGTAQYTITDLKGNEHKSIPESALFVPDFPVSLFSVKSVTYHGTKVTFIKGGANSYVKESSTLCQLLMHPSTLQEHWSNGINL